MVSLKCFASDADLDLILMTDSGTIIKLPFEQVSTLKRVTQGVRLMNLKDEQKVSTVALVEKEKEDEELTESVEDPLGIQNINPQETVENESIETIIDEGNSEFDVDIPTDEDDITDDEI